MSLLRGQGALTKDDLASLLEDTSVRTPADTGPRNINLSARPGVSLLMLSTLIVLLVVVLDQGGAQGFARYVILGLIAVLGALGLLLGVALVFSRVITPRAMASMPGALGHRVYTITDEGLHEDSDIGEGTTRWSAFTEVRDTDTHLFFYRGNIAGAVIPRRFFASDADFAAFLQEARAQIEAAPPVADVPRATVVSDDSKPSAD